MIIVDGVPLRLVTNPHLQELQFLGYRYQDVNILEDALVNGLGE